MRRWLVTLLGVVMMASSVYGFGLYAERRTYEAETVEAVMPARLIAGGETVEPSMLRRVTIPKAALSADALRDEASIVGRTAVTLIGPNETIADWKLADRQLTPREGERYISFPTDEISNVGNLLRRGDQIDVWVELDRPLMVAGVSVGAVKAIEGLVVASVRTAEGAEVTDAGALDAAFQSAAKQRERVRSAANGKPAVNTFIMNEEIYAAYALAALAGTMKFALPDPSLHEERPARVTDDFAKYRDVLIEELGTQ